MAYTAYLVCLVSNVSGGRKNTLWKASASSRHKTKQAGQQGIWSGMLADMAVRAAQSVPCLPALFCALLTSFCWSGCFTN